MVDEFEFPENFEEISNNLLMSLEKEYKLYNNSDIERKIKLNERR